MKKLTIMIVVVLIASSMGFSAGVGGMEGSFLSWGAGARSSGVGKAYVAMVDDASASYWNPGALMSVDAMEIQALHTLLWEGVNYDYLGFAYPTVTQGVFGGNIVMLRVGDVERRDSNNNVVSGSFENLKIGATVGYGRKIFNWMDVGVSVKYIARSMDSEMTGFITGDIGLMLTFIDGLRIGIVGEHLASVKFGDTDDRVVPRAKIGASYKLKDIGLTIAAGAEMMVVGDVRKYIKDLISWQVGVEYAMIGPFSVRAGMDRLMPSAGVGFKYNNILKLDYSASLHSELGLSHWISLGVKLGKSVNISRMDKAKEIYERAIHEYEIGNKQKARKLFNELQSYDWENEVSKKMIRKLVNSQ